MINPPDNKVRNPDSLHVIDHKAFGEQVIRWALMKPELRPKTIGDMKARFNDAAMALSIPDHATDNSTIEMAQGNESRDLIMLPPLYKLLPMLEYLGQTWEDYNLSENELGFDPASPPTAKAFSDSTEHYKVPAFYRNIDEEHPDYVSLFLLRVGDYSCQGCR